MVENAGWKTWKRRKGGKRAIAIPVISVLQALICERFEPKSHFKSRLSLIVRVNVVLKRTVVVDSD